jgi:hypothetical protein
MTARVESRKHGKAKARAAYGKRPAPKPAPKPVARDPGAKGRLTARGKVAPQTGRQKTEAAMEKRLAELERGTPRYRTLEAAIEFKRSWVELAHELSEVLRAGSFKEWGYRTFEAYALHELNLKRDTAQKLVRSYDFLATHERRVLESADQRDAHVPLPSYQALDVLAEARQNPYLSERDYRELRDQVFTDDPTPSQIRKAVRERAPEQPAEKPAAGDALRRCLSLAERLYGMVLEQESLPTRIAEALEEVVGALRQMVEE